MKHLLGQTVLAALAASICGCATVNPRLDYDRAAEKVAAATGYSLDYRPDEDACVEGRVRELLDGGLTADEAARVALLNSRKIQAALYDIGASRADLVQAGLLSNPNLSFAAEFLDGGGLPKLQGSLSQNIADLWQIPIRKRASQRALERVVLQVARDASVVVYDAKTAYYEAVQADRKRQIATDTIQIARQVLDMALARQEAGAGGEVDVNLARSEVYDAELLLSNAELEAFAARSTLARQLSLTGPPDALELIETIPEQQLPNLSDEVLLPLAAERLDIQAAASLVKATLARIKEEKLKVFPTLEVGVGFERQERPSAEGRNILADSVRSSIAAGEPSVEIAPLEKEPTEVVTGPSIGMELPIFNQNQGGIARARYAHQQSLKLLDEVSIAASQEVRLAAARARTAWANLAFYRDQVLPLRETSLDLARTAYQAGRTPLLNVLEAERALLNARGGYSESLQSSAAALVELERATGQPMARILQSGSQVMGQENEKVPPTSQSAVDNSGELL